MSAAGSAAVLEALRQLPKTETHLHIEGALPWECLRGLDAARYAQVPPSWAADYRFASFADFEQALLDAAVPWYTDAERYHAAARIIFDKLWREEGVRYVETSFASGVIEYARLDGAAVAAAIKAAAPAGMEVRVFMGIHHHGYNPRSCDFIEASLGWAALDGLDLHGEETLPLEPWTADLWARARAAGKVTKAHAGEFCGPDFVRRVVEELGVTRIQHGVRAVEDPQLPTWLAQRGVSMDVCPISNVKLRVAPSFAEHPLRSLLAAGVRCTLSTDDPMTFGNRLRDEYAALYLEGGYTIAQLLQCMRNGLELALVEAPQRAQWLAEFERAVSASAALQQSE